MPPSANTIKEIAQDVYETLGSGFSEDVYDRAMQVGLRLEKIGYEGQKVVEKSVVMCCTLPLVIVKVTEKDFLF
jgi:PD-(D/E)XK nuclease superfamily